MLPNAHLAFVDPDKLTGYLLNRAHREGAGKAKFLESLGPGHAETSKENAPMSHDIAEHDTAVLLRDIPELGLLAGDFGVVIHIHRDAASGAVLGYLLERFAANGEALDEVSVPRDSVRPAKAGFVWSPPSEALACEG